MEIGLYQAKYPFRKLLAFLLQRLKPIPPNYISCLLFPIGLITAWVYYQASTSFPLLLGRDWTDFYAHGGRNPRWDGSGDLS